MIGAILLPIFGCWFGMFAIRYSVRGLKQSKKKEEVMNVITSTFTYVYAILWTIICASLGYASYRVFDCFRVSEYVLNGTTIAALVLYLLQLILYWSWMPVLIKFHPFIGVCYDSY